MAKINNIDNLLKNKDKMISLISKWWLWHFDSASLRASLSSLENLREKYNDTDNEWKIRILWFMDEEYKDIVSHIPTLKNKILEKKQLANESWDNKLLNEYNKTFQDIDIIDKTINKDEQEEVDDFLWVTINKPLIDKEKDVQKQVTIPNAQSTNVWVQPLTYQDRRIVKDPTTWTWWYESKQTWWIKWWFKDEASAKKSIDENLKEYYWVWIRNAILNKDENKQKELESWMQKRWLTKEQVEAWLSE